MFRLVYLRLLIDISSPFGLTPADGIALLCDEVISRVRA
jgi:hypothetical protein